MSAETPDDAARANSEGAGLEGFGAYALITYCRAYAPDIYTRVKRDGEYKSIALPNLTAVELLQALQLWADMGHRPLRVIPDPPIPEPR